MNITEETNDVLAVKPFDNQLKASPELHPSLPQHPFCTMMVAPAGGGKTTTILRMIYGNRKPKNHTGKHKHYKFYRHFFDRIYVFSPSRENDAKCSICKIPSEQIFEDVDIYDEVLQEILDTQEESIREDGKENTDKVLLVFSDLAGSKFYTQRKGTLSKICFNRRHYNVSVILDTQTLRQISPGFRNNLSGLMLFSGISNKLELDKICTEYLGMFDKKDAMRLLKYVFDSGKFAFLFINMQNKQFYRNFNLLTITETVD